MKTIAILTLLALSAPLAMAADKGDKKDPAAMFSSLDSNKDGAVAKEEYMASKKAQKDAAKAGKRFERQDANKDGKLTKEEFGVTEAKKDEPAPAAPAKPDEKKPEEKKPADQK